MHHGIVERMKLKIGIALLAMVGAAESITAGDVRFGPQASYGMGGDADAGFGVGARAVIDLAEQRPGLAVVASLDYFPSPEGSAEGFGVEVDVSYLELNASLTHTFGARRGRVRRAKATRLTPYVGAGLNIARASSSVKAEGIATSSSDIDLGVNVLGGLKLTPNVFVEVRAEVGGGEQLVLTAGYVF